jgi:hypothetical protein
MKVNLQPVGLWDVIESDTDDYREDWSTLAAILHVVPLEMQVGLTVKPGKSVEDFSLHLNTMVSQLRMLGDDITDKEVIQHMLHSVPKKLEQVAISMETLLDLDLLSIEEAMEHLRAVEQSKKPPVAKENRVGYSSQRSGWLP